MPTWVAAILTISTGIVAWAGFILAFKSYLKEKPKLRFVLEAKRGYYGSPEDEESLCCVLCAQVTNTGRAPVALNKLICGYRNKEAKMKQSVDLTHIRLGHGEAGLVELIFEKWPSTIDSISVRDSTGKIWCAGRRDIDTLRESAQIHWGWPR